MRIGRAWNRLRRNWEVRNRVIDGRIEYIILSFPRSGNHWVRYITEWFSGAPTLGDKEGEHPKDIINLLDRPICKRSRIPHARNTHPIAKKRHQLEEHDDTGASLVFILRDFKECIPRHYGRNDITGIEDTKALLDWYLRLVGTYEKWPSRKKLILYEDLIQLPQDTTESLLRFMGIYDEYEHRTFLGTHYSWHVKNSLKALTSTSMTHGRAVDYHKKKLSRHLRLDMDQYLINQNPHLYHKYLSRYKEST